MPTIPNVGVNFAINKIGSGYSFDTDGVIFSLQPGLGNFLSPHVGCALSSIFACWLFTINSSLACQFIKPCL